MANDHSQAIEMKTVVIIGGGFGGLSAAKALGKAPVYITLIDRTNHHLFQPLLYQVAMAGLSPADIAYPIRAIMRDNQKARVLLAEVVGVDLPENRLKLDDGSEVTYDYLILAMGGQTSYFGHEEWRGIAPGLKSLADAVEIRQRVLLAYERAEREHDATRRAALMTFVVIGGGPTGVELAGALAELGRTVLASDFRSIDPTMSRVILLEGGPRILASFPEDLAAKARKQAQDLGVEIRVNAHVDKIEEGGVCLGKELIPSETIIWAAGVSASPLTAKLGVPLDRAGRIVVAPDLTIPGHRNVFAIGDTANFSHQTGQPLPGVSPVAMQMGRQVAKNIARDLKNLPYQPFAYFDKGTMATIGRAAAIAEIGRIHLSGFIAWIVWVFIHILFLIGFRNRLSVLFNWAWSYFSYQRGARLIAGYGITREPQVGGTEPKESGKAAPR